MARPKNSKAKGGKKNRKKGRNAAWCAAYRAGCRREINKRRRVARHCRRHPADLEARRALDRLTR